MKEKIRVVIVLLVEQLFAVQANVELTRPEEQFGDYATNVALQLSKQLGKNPRDIAETLAAALRHEPGGHLSEITVAGPGFINIKLTDQALLETLSRPQATFIGQKVVIETNNPNPFKAMHIGHAFNAVIGDTLANLLETGGNQTHRVSYHGDVGAHVGRSMWAILKYINGDVSKLEAIPPGERNAFMSGMYASGTKLYKEDEAIKAEMDRLAEESFVLQDPLYKAVYETCKAWSFELLDEAIERLGCKPTEKRYLERQADKVGVTTVREHVGSVFQQSGGALIFDGSAYGSFANVFVSSRGRGLYAARDLGLMQLKQQDYNPDKSYVVTAEEQRDYFKGVIKAAELCLPELNDVTVNISTGTVKLATGKMSSRDGNVLDIAWLFKQVEDAIHSRGGEPVQDVVAGALRYEFLRVRIGGDVMFDATQAVNITGNSGPYLQYAHARARSILRKAKTAPTKITIDSGLQPGERSLLRKIAEYPEVIDKSVGELLPHYICTYLYELAQTFNRFYETNQVVNNAREQMRLPLVQAYAGTLRDGLSILGIVSPEEM